MASQRLSNRALETAFQLDIPWRFALRGNYDAEVNPEGLTSFASAENVRTDAACPKPSPAH
jgi:hypothetical protein